MRNILSTLIAKLCRAQTLRRLKRYGVESSCVSLDKLEYALDAVPGMMAPEAGPVLFILSATQELSGDVIEVGSWQGRSTIYLAKGAQVNGNGQVYAIDHFLGNPGKELLYRAERNDLSDLEGCFRGHVSSFKVSEYIELMAMSSTAAAMILRERSVRARLLFIDGNHAFNAVMEDFEALRPVLLPQGLVIFDDFSPTFPGVVKCVGELVDGKIIRPIFSYGNCFVGQYVGDGQHEP